MTTENSAPLLTPKRGLRILHTSDLHLGQCLYERSREDTFLKLLDFLVKTVKELKIDALIIAGDVFDSINPPNYAQKMYYDFLSKLTTDTALQQVIIVSGNHDSGQHLEITKNLTQRLGITVVGKLPLQIADELVLLKDSQGEAAAVVCAVPYLREGEIREITLGESYQDRREKTVEATKRHYRKVVDAALELSQSLGKKLPIIATGHLYAAGTELTEGVRDLYIGYEGSVPVTVFPDEIDYLALGHIHRAQLIKGAKTPGSRRYSGSPIMMSFSELSTPKEVVMAEFVDGDTEVTPISVPEFEHLVRISGRSLDEIKAQILAVKTPSFAEVVYLGEHRIPLLREEILACAANSVLDLLRIVDRTDESSVAPAGPEQASQIARLSLQDVFAKRLEHCNFDQEEKDLMTELFQKVVTAFERGDENLDGVDEIDDPDEQNSQTAQQDPKVI